MKIIPLKPLIVLAILFPCVLFGQSIFKCNDGAILFYSYAAQEIIKAKSEKLAGVMNTKDKTFAFAVNIQSFEGFNSSLQQEHFNEKYLETEKYPTAKFIGKIIEDVDLTKDGTYEVRAKGTLKIHNVEQERIIKSTVIVSKGAIAIKSSFNVFLSDHNIRIPKVVHEKIASEIDVNVDARMVAVK